MHLALILLAFAPAILAAAEGSAAAALVGVAFGGFALLNGALWPLLGLAVWLAGYALTWRVLYRRDLLRAMQ
jgi:hypothetical protein